ncbi:MAG: AAA family ATPase [Luteolibacter sp.]|uniref:AAA family ATPase n=1 Tax=Luteolibacter sp. TaxID=1962973 RepID=UPI00326695F8
MKKILIIAGPNGAGKTTFAGEFLPNEACCPEFVNADLIAAGLSPFQPDQVAFTAGRLMLGRIRDLVRAGKSFAFETTLSTRSDLRLIPRWQAAGYRVKLWFLRLPDADFAIRRVERRVLHGGHDIPAPTIGRRFERGWENLRNDYLGMADEWSIYDGSQDPPQLMETGDNRPPQKLMEDPVPYRTNATGPPQVEPLDDPDFIGAEAALKRASAKAVARDRAAGLEPIIRIPEDLPKKP